MNIEEYRDYCLSVKGATECMPFGENILVFKIMDKMFTFATLRPKNGNFWADMKCAPDKAEELIEQYGDIFWGPFSDKKHWITVYLEGDVPDKLIKELISHSVEEVIKKLPKKKQEEYNAKYQEAEQDKKELDNLIKTLKTATSKRADELETAIKSLAK